MLGQEFLHTALAEENIEGGQLEACDYLADNDYVIIPEATKYAIVIKEQPFDFQQVAQQVNSTKKLEDYTVNILMVTKQDNELTNDYLIEKRDALQAEAEKIVKIIISRKNTYNGIANVLFGKADPDLMTVEARQFYLMPIPVKITTVKKQN